MLKKIPLKQRRKRDKVIMQARKVFRYYGYKKTTMDDIAKEMRMGKSSLYYYFESKTEIYNAVVLYEAILYRKLVMASIDENSSPYVKLKSYVLNRMQTDEILPNFHQALKDPKLRNLEFVERLNKLYDKEEFRLFSNILQSGVEAGYFEIPDIDDAAVGIVTAMRGLEATIIRNQNNIQIESRIDNILKIILYGIVKRN
jgi:AcrR family transcriptional regulator